jgi:PIN domain nuclease of toxin-antitoxin system
VIALDASAVLALLFREHGHQEVATVFGDSCMSTVNLAEVLGRFARDGHDTSLVLRRIVSSPVELVGFDSEDAELAASLLPKTQPHGLSLGDRACLALAMTRSIPAMTADRAWLEVPIDVPIRCIR